MYDNIGEKIKLLAKIVFILEAIVAVIAGIALLATDDSFAFVGLLTLFCGPIIAWVGSWILYGFGVLVEDVHIIRNGEATTVEATTVEATTVEATTVEATHKPNFKSDTEEISDNTPVIYETVIPIYDKKYDIYVCPSCGSELRKGQKQCLCRKMLDWNNIQ